MSEEVETKEVTKTETLYKIYTFDEINNRLVIIWSSRKPWADESNLENATRFLKEGQKMILNRNKKELEKAQETVSDLLDSVTHWENVVNTDPTVVDKTK